MRHCYPLSAAPVIKLIEVVDKINNLECTTSCNSTIAWRVHAPLDVKRSRWYETIATSVSGTQCTERIALTTVWPQSVNVVSVQCIAVSVLSTETQTYIQSVCLRGV